MSFNKYFQDELSYLRSLGQEFATAYPRLAPFLGENRQDPDVERLLEGFAFLSGRVRQKLDDELPELTHSLISLLWPHFLRPVPCMSVLRLRPVVNAISEKKTVPRGAEVDSVPVDGTRCRFRTCYDVDLYPLELTRVELRRELSRHVLTLGFETHGGASLEQMDLDRVRLYLHGEPALCQTLYLYLSREVVGVRVEAGRDGSRKVGFSLPGDKLRPAGLAAEEACIPYPPNAFPGYRLLQEYFSLPQKFYFFDLFGLEGCRTFRGADGFRVEIEFGRVFDDELKVKPENLLLYCTPIINLLHKEADPIRLSQRAAEYRLKPSGADPNHFEVFDIERVEGWVKATGGKRRYRPFLSFAAATDSGEEKELFFRSRIRPAVVGKGVDTYLSFVDAKGVAPLPSAETVSVELTASNRNLPEKLHAGDIRIATGTSPEFASFANVSPPSKAVSPPLGDGLEWKLISNMSLNYLSLGNVDALRLILSTYNFGAYHDRQTQLLNQHRMEALREIRVEPSVHLFRGLPVRGSRIQLEIDGSKFSGPGDLYLFAGILNEFFALYATLNSYNQLSVHDVDKGEHYQWPPRVGEQRLL